VFDNKCAEGREEVSTRARVPRAPRRSFGLEKRVSLQATHHIKVVCVVSSFLFIDAWENARLAKRLKEN